MFDKSAQVALFIAVIDTIINVCNERKSKTWHKDKKEEIQELKTEIEALDNLEAHLNIVIDSDY